MNGSYRMAGRVLLGVCCAGIICSCSASPSDLIKKHQAEYNKTLANLDAIAGKIGNQKLESEAVSLPATGPALSLDDIYPFYNYNDGASSAQLFSAEDLTDPEEKNTGMHLFSAKRQWQLVKKMVRDGKFPESKEDAVKILNRVAGWRYAVVLRSSKVQAPEIAGNTVIGNVADKTTYASGSFVPGTLEGHVLIYDLEDGSFLGGFPVTARSSDQLDINTYGGDDPSGQHQRALIHDLTQQIQIAVFYGLLDKLPQDRTSMNGNIRADANSGKGRRR